LTSTVNNRVISVSGAKTLGRRYEFRGWLVAPC
jgi:hypothetical protein